MKPLFNRTRIASGVLALAVAATAGLATPATARAQTTFVPSAADFKNCPTLPTGSVKLLWTCVSISMIGGTMKIGSLNQTITDPIQINVAVGPQNGKITTIMGKMSGSAMQVPTGINFPGFDTVGVEVTQAGTMKMDGLMPSEIPLKVHVIHWILGPVCYIGSDSDPMRIKPTMSNLRLENMSGTQVIRTDVSDSTFAVPGAAGCGLFNGMVNDMAGLPSAAGNNSMTMDTVIQMQNYASGNITAKAAAKLS